MKALVIEKPGSFRIREVPYPEPDHGEVTVKVEACCICGTDAKIIKGDMAGIEYPLIPGHEFAGRVDRVGPGVTDLRAGDLVSLEGTMSCGHCYFCQIGDYNVCPKGTTLGISKSREGLKLDGGFAEYTVVPRKNLYVFKNVSSQEASFLPNLNTAVYGLRRTRFHPGSRMLIIGSGTMGLLFVELAKASGASFVAVTDKAENRLKMAEELGADAAILADEAQDESLRKLAPTGFDLVVECVGEANLLQRCIDHTRSRGQILLFGLAPKDQTAVINPFEITRKNLDIIASMSAALCAPAARDLIDQGVIKIAPLITHKFPLAEFEQALGQAGRHEECIRVVVEP